MIKGSTAGSGNGSVRQAAGQAVGQAVVISTTYITTTTIVNQFVPVPAYDENSIIAKAEAVRWCLELVPAELPALSAAAAQQLGPDRDSILAGCETAEESIERIYAHLHRIGGHMPEPLSGVLTDAKFVHSRPHHPRLYVIDADGRRLTSGQQAYTAATSVELGEADAAIAWLVVKLGSAKDLTFGAVPPGFRSMCRAAGGGDAPVCCESCFHPLIDGDVGDVAAPKPCIGCGKVIRGLPMTDDVPGHDVLGRGTQGIGLTCGGLLWWDCDRRVEGTLEWLSYLAEMRVPAHRRPPLEGSCGAVGNGARVSVQWRALHRQLVWAFDGATVLSIRGDFRGWSFAIGGRLNMVEIVDPQGTDPQGTDPQGTDPQGTDPQGLRPLAAAAPQPLLRKSTSHAASFKGLGAPRQLPLIVPSVAPVPVPAPVGGDVSMPVAAPLPVPGTEGSCAQHTTVVTNVTTTVVTFVPVSPADAGSVVAKAEVVRSCLGLAPSSAVPGANPLLQIAVAAASKLSPYLAPQFEGCDMADTIARIYDHLACSGWTLLMYEVVFGGTDRARAMIEAGAALDVPCGPDQYTSLMAACKHGREDMVRLLLEKGADPALRNADGWTALLFASGRNESTLPKPATAVATAFAAANPTARAIHDAIADAVPGHAGPFLGICRVLLDAGLSVNQTSVDGLSPLIRAAMSGVDRGDDNVRCHVAPHADACVRMLLDANACVEDPSAPLSALFMAASVGDLQVVQTLLEARADVNRAASALANHFTPLMVAAQNGDADVVRALLKAGADVLYRMPSGAASETVIQRRKDEPEDNADRGITAGVGPCALAMAVQQEQQETARLLLRAGAPVTVAVNHELLKQWPWYRRGRARDEWNIATTR